jgi:hypothetical protein
VDALKTLITNETERLASAPIPAGSSIEGIEVRLDARVGAGQASGTRQMWVHARCASSSPGTAALAGRAAAAALRPRAS